MVIQIQLNRDGLRRPPGVSKKVRNDEKWPKWIESETLHFDSGISVLQKTFGVKPGR